MTDQPTNDISSATTRRDRKPSLLGRTLRLGLGGVTFGINAVQGQVRSLVQPAASSAATTDGAEAPSAPPAQPAALEQVIEGAVDSMVGLAVVGAETARRGSAAVWSANKRAWEATAPLRQPLEALGLTNLALKPLEAVRSRVEPAVNRLQEAGQAELEASRQVTLATITDVVDTVVAYLNQSPEVGALIRTQVDRLLPELAEHPAIHALVRRQVDMLLPVLAADMAVHRLIQAQVEMILPELQDSPLIQELIKAQAGQYLQHLQDNPDPVQALIRVQGDAYIDYLNAHPDAVQNLVSGQSIGIAGQVMDEVRERTVTADSVAEMLARSLLRKKPRSEITEPPAAVQRRASVAVLPSDYIRRKE